MTKLTNRSPTVSQSVVQTNEGRILDRVTQVSLGQLELRLRLMRLTLMMQKAPEAPRSDAADEADEADEGSIWPPQPQPQLQLAKADLSDPYRGCGPLLCEQLTA